MKSLSIVLCTYNGAAYLREQMLTLRAQSGVMEIVVVDDGSSDGTWGILEDHARSDARIRLHRNPEPLGVTRNFERAISLARGEWIALADQDDVWLPEKLARMRKAWDGHAVLLHHATRKFRGAPPPELPSPAGERRKFSGRDVRRMLYRNSVVGHTTLVQSVVARQAMPFPSAVPHDWWLGVIAASGGGVQYVDEYLVHYRIHQGNAYHAAGSRWRRLRSENGLRLELLRALAVRRELAGEASDFVKDFLRLLTRAEAGVFPWALWRFYRRHAAVLFNGWQPLSRVRRFRRALQAALGTMLWAPDAPQAEVGRPQRPVAMPDAGLFRRTG